MEINEETQLTLFQSQLDQKWESWVDTTMKVATPNDVLKHLKRIMEMSVEEMRQLSNDDLDAIRKMYCLGMSEVWVRGARIGLAAKKEAESEKRSDKG
jgi:hypothetical protein